MESNFHASRLAEPSSWAGIGGFLLTVAHSTTGTVSVVLITLSTVAFGASYFLREKLSGVGSLMQNVNEFLQKASTPAPKQPTAAPQGVPPASL